MHRRILIEGNQVVGPDGERGIYVSGVSDVTIRFNQIAAVGTPIEVRHSDRVAVYENGGVGARLGPEVTTVAPGAERLPDPPVRR